MDAVMRRKWAMRNQILKLKSVMCFAGGITLLMYDSKMNQKYDKTIMLLLLEGKGTTKICWVPRSGFENFRPLKKSQPPFFLPKKTLSPPFFLPKKVCAPPFLARKKLFVPLFSSKKTLRPPLLILHK